METLIRITAKEIIDLGVWDKFCYLTGINAWAVAEGLMSSDETLWLTQEQAKELGII